MGFLLLWYGSVPDVGHRVVDQLQGLDEEVFTEVGFGEELDGDLTEVQVAESVPVAPTLTQLWNGRAQMGQLN